MEADEDQPERRLAQLEEALAAGDMRQPVVERGQHREDEAADQHVMQMRGDEGRVVHLPVERARSPPSRRSARRSRRWRRSRGSRASAGAVCGRPFHSVPIQAKTCTPVGTATSVEAAEKKASAMCGMPVANMWCTQRPKLRNASATRRRHDPAVAEQRRARHHRQDGRDHARRRQEDDVDLGMAEQPEQVLPQQAVAALRRPGRRAAPKARSSSSRIEPRISGGKPVRIISAVDERIPGEDRHAGRSVMPGAR